MSDLQTITASAVIPYPLGTVRQGITGTDAGRQQKLATTLPEYIAEHLA